MLCFPLSAKSNPGESVLQGHIPPQGHTTLPRNSATSEKGCVHGASWTRWCHVPTPGTATIRAAIGWLKRLKAESAEEGGPEGAQVEVPVMLMRFADVGGHLPIRIVQTSLDGAAAAEF